MSGENCSIYKISAPKSVFNQSHGQLKLVVETTCWNSMLLSLFSCESFDWTWLTKQITLKICFNADLVSRISWIYQHICLFILHTVTVSEKVYIMRHILLSVKTDNWPASGTISETLIACTDQRHIYIRFI